jgi:hypothetical protein
MKITARIIADVDPEIKQKLKELSSFEGVSMVQILTKLIEEAHKKGVKK